MTFIADVISRILITDSSLIRPLEVSRILRHAPFFQVTNGEWIGQKALSRYRGLPPNQVFLWNGGEP